MVIRDLDLVGISGLPTKANAVLLIDPNAVLPPSLASQAFESVTRRDGQISQVADPANLIEFPPSGGPQPLRTGSPGRRGIRPVKDILRLSVPERAYHLSHDIE